MPSGPIRVNEGRRARGAIAARAMVIIWLSGLAILVTLLPPLQAAVAGPLAAGGDPVAVANPAGARLSAAAVAARPAGITPTGTATTTLLLPILRSPYVAPPPLPPPIPLTGTPPIDFAARRVELRDQGLDLAFNKIGFHHGIGGIPGDDAEFVAMMTELDAAGVPIFLKSTDNAQPVYIAQELMRASGVPHTLIYRRASSGGTNYDTPNYGLPPADAAAQHWQLHKAVFPPELDPSLVWIETINEVDRNRAEWLAEFALETAQLAIADGFRWAAFGWSTGEPEPEHWESPAMLAFLQFAADHPDQVAIALHEYSLVTGEIGRWYPDLVGRFQALFQVCDDHGIPRPTVLITEWGWTPTQVPTVAEAMADVAWASWLYAAYPQVKGAAVWYLGGGFGGIAEQARQLIGPLQAFSISHYYAYTPGQGSINSSLFAPDPPTRQRPR